MSKLKGGNVESCSRIKDGNGRSAPEEEEVQRIWKDYFEDYIIYNMCGFDGVHRGNNFGGELIKRTEVKVRKG